MAYEGNEFAAMMAIRNQSVTKAVEHLLGICTGLVADNRIDDAEVRFLDLWLNQYPEVTTAWPGSVIAERLRLILADGVITTEERDDLLETLKGICGFQLAETGAAEAAVATIPFDDDPSIYFDGRSFCFTGRFLVSTRRTRLAVSLRRRRPAASDAAATPQSCCRAASAAVRAHPSDTRRAHGR